MSSPKPRLIKPHLQQQHPPIQLKKTAASRKRELFEKLIESQTRVVIKLRGISCGKGLSIGWIATASRSSTMMRGRFLSLNIACNYIRREKAEKGGSSDD